MENLVVLDAGPLIALINRGDFHHAWAVGELARMSEALVTCEAVISESHHLVRQNPVGISTLLSYLDEGIVRLDFNLKENLAPVTGLMRKYRDVPMSLADACLVRMSEIYPAARVFTLDADFKLYGRQSIPLICPAP